MIAPACAHATCLAFLVPTRPVSLHVSPLSACELTTSAPHRFPSDVMMTAQANKAVIRGAAYAILAATAAFASFQVPVWQAVISTEFRKAAVAKGLASNPALRQKVASMIAQSYARPLPEDFDFSKKAYAEDTDGIQRLLSDLIDKYTHVVGGSEMTEFASNYGSVPFVLRTEDYQLVVTRVEQEWGREGGGLEVGDEIELIQGMSTKGGRTNAVVYTLG